MTGTRRYTLGGATVAVRVASGGLKYLFNDIQGSNTLAVPAATSYTASTAVTRQRYTPYGALRGQSELSLPTQHGWLDKTHDPDNGLTYLNNRYYDPAISRFLAPDPLMVPSDPSSLNPYTYAASNPLTYSDPSGLCYQNYATGEYEGEDCGSKNQASAGSGGSSGGGGSGGGSGRGGSSSSSTAVFEELTRQVYGWAGPDFVGPTTPNILTNPANWCLVGKPVGTQGPCGAPPNGEYAGDSASAVSDYLMYYGALSDGSVGAVNGGTKTVFRYVAGRQARIVVLDYKKGLEDLKSILPPAQKVLVRAQLVNKAFFATQVAYEANSAWSDSSKEGTAYQVGYTSARTVSVAAGAWAGAEVGATAGAKVGGSAGALFDGVGAAPGALVGGFLGGAVGGVSGGWGARRVMRNLLVFNESERRGK